MANKSKNGGAAVAEQENAADGIKQTWQEGTEAVTEAVERVKETMETTVDRVKDTAATAAQAVQQSAEAVGRAFNVAEYVRQYPWLAFGGAVVLGILIGRMLDDMRS